MAGSVPRGSGGQGRSSRPGSSSIPVDALRTARPGRTSVRTSATPSNGGPLTTPAAVPAASPATTPPATRAVYRLLLMKGMSPAEAANLTAFVCGLSTTDVRWSLRQVNQLLFLRAMRQAGRFDDIDGNAIRKRPD